MPAPPGAAGKVVNHGDEFRESEAELIEIVRETFQEAQRRSVQQLESRLSKRELEMLVQMLRGLTTAEREAIFSIHLKKHGRDKTKFDLARLVTAADSYTGAEIEQAVISGLYAAFAA